MVGHLHFLGQKIYYEYKQFKKKFIEPKPFYLNILGIFFPGEGLLEQLKSVLTKIINIKVVVLLL